MPKPTETTMTHPGNTTTTTPVKPPPAPIQPRRSNRHAYQDVNHLLGFTLPPRAPPPPAGPRRSSKRNPNYGVFDKQRYISSTFRFVVKPTSDYTAMFADPDLHIAWEDILQVVVDTTSALSSASTSTIDQPVQQHHSHDGSHAQAIPTCPICLSVPTAARMTRCGHIYCLPCMLHYLALANGTKWRKCPVCWDAVYARDLKSVKWHDPILASSTSAPTSTAFTIPTAPLNDLNPDPPPTIGEPLKMRLIRRPQITTLALPRSPTWPSEAVPSLRAPWTFTPDALSFARFVLGAPEYVAAELDRELRELDIELRGLQRGGDELGAGFVLRAREKVEEQRARTEELKTQSVMTARKRALRELEEVHARLVNDGGSAAAAAETSSSEAEDSSEVPREFLLATRNPAFYPSSSPATAVPLPVAVSATARRPPPEEQQPATDGDSSYFFYQAASGQNVFLSPLDIKVLKSHFGTYTGMPDTLLVALEALSEGSMSADLRRRCRWLAHIPTSADVVFVEIDLERVVGKEGVEPFAAALKMRRNKRRDKVRREDKAKAKSELKEVESRPAFERSSSFGTGGGETFFDLPNFPTVNPSETLPLIDPPPSSTGTTTVWGTRSFASALRPSGGGVGGDYEDDEFDEHWHAFEENLRGSGGGARRSGGGGGGASANSNAGGGGGGGGGRKKGKKLVLNLTGASGRGRG